MTYGDQPGRSGSRRALPLLLAAVVGLVLVLVVRAVVGGDDGAATGPGGGRAAGGDRRDCLPLKVTASSEKAALLSAIAGEYNRAGRGVDGRCVDV